MFSKVAAVTPEGQIPEIPSEKSSLNAFLDELPKVVEKFAKLEDRANKVVGDVGGLTSKMHVVVDGNGLSVQLGLTGGQAHRQPALLGLAEIPTSARAVAGRSRLRRGLDQSICH